MSLLPRVCKNMFMKRWDMAFSISLQRSLLHGPHLRRAPLSSMYLTPTCSKHGVATASKKNRAKKITTPKKVGHMKIISTVIQVPKITHWNLYLKTKDITKNEVRELLEKGGIKPTKTKIYRARSNLLLLVQGGCSVEKAKACLSLITMNHRQLLEVVTALKEIDFEVIHPDFIVTLIKTTIKELELTADNWICDKFGFRQRRELIQAVFDLTTDEFKHYEKEQKYFQGISEIPKFLKKVYLLLESGVKMKEIKSNFWLLDFSVEAIQKINSFQLSLPEVKLWPWILQDFETEKMNSTLMPEGEKKNEKLQNESIKKLKIHVYNKNKYDLLTLILGVDIKHLTTFHMMKKMEWERLAEKLEFLLEHNIPSNDIVNHIYVLKRGRMESILEVVEMTEKANVQKRVITQLVKLETFYFERLVSHLELAKLLNIRTDEVLSFGLPDKWRTNPKKIRKNFDFLIEQGFSKEDIKSCPLLLGHRGDILEKYLENWKNRWQLKQYENDKHKYLNALQYLIWKDHMNIFRL